MYYKKSLEGVFGRLKTNENGLSRKQVRERLEKYGKNELKEKEKDSTFKIFIDNFKDPLVMILLLVIAVQISMGKLMESSIIMAVLVLNSILGVIQTKKAQGSIDSLKKMSIPSTKVIRDGIKVVVDSNELVPGDIVLVEAGDYIPADGRIIESESLKIIESMLTGESEPIEKHSNKIKTDCALGDQKNMVFSSSMVVYGRGKFVVTTTGMDTEVGKVAGLLNDADSGQTPLQNKLEAFSKKLGKMIMLLASLIFLAQVIRGVEVIDSLMYSIAIAVAAIPEALSSIVTIVLSLGTNTMAKKNAIVRKLYAVETLGSTSIICTDKTGTLTKNQMTVVDYYTGESDLKEKLMTSSVLCSDADINEEGKEIGDPTEVAFIRYAKDNNLDVNKLREDNKRTAELPFDSERKLMSVISNINNESIMVTKGAPDVVFDRCKYVLVNNKEVEITEEILNSYRNKNEEFSKRALRVLAVAMKSNTKDKLSMEDEDDLILIGIMAMIDPPRDEVYDAVADAKNAGIKTIMITGDHKTTACAIASQIGIFTEGEIALTGKELDDLSDEQLDDKLEHISVYARVSPENKIRIVKAWQRKGKVTAMTGDGVNDSPALKQADIGIGMGSGTEVAKEASAMVLVDDNFATIVKSVEVGRSIYDNIKKSITYLFSGNLGGIVSILFALFANLPNPFTTIQLLFMNLVTDSLPAIALGLEKSEKDIMNEKPRDKDESILSKSTLKTIGLRGLVIGSVVITAQIIGTKTSNELGVAMAFSTLTLARIIQTIPARSNNKTIFELGIMSNKYVIYSVIVCMGLYLGVLLPPFREVFSIPVGFGFNEVSICLLLALLSSVIMEGSKMFRKNNKVNNSEINIEKANEILYTKTVKNNN